MYIMVISGFKDYGVIFSFQFSAFSKHLTMSIYHAFIIRKKNMIKTKLKIYPVTLNDKIFFIFIFKSWITNCSRRQKMDM